MLLGAVQVSASYLHRPSSPLIQRVTGTVLMGPAVVPSHATSVAAAGTGSQTGGKQALQPVIMQFCPSAHEVHCIMLEGHSHNDTAGATAGDHLLLSLTAARCKGVARWPLVCAAVLTKLLDAKHTTRK